MFVRPTNSVFAAVGILAIPESTASPFHMPMTRGRAILTERMRRFMEPSLATAAVPENVQSRKADPPRVRSAPSRRLDSALAVSARGADRGRQHFAGRL